MARKPAHILAASAKPTGRQAVWDEIRLHRGMTFSVNELARQTDVPARTICDFLDALEAAGIIAPDGPHTYRSSTPFRLVRDVGAEAPRLTKEGKPVTQGAAREQMWRAMKMIRGEFTAPELAIAASIEGSPVATVDAKDYCKHLAMAGYLVISKKGRAGTLGRYRFIPSRNTGPRPPMVARTKLVFDPNLNLVMWHPEIDV